MSSLPAYSPAAQAFQSPVDTAHPLRRAVIVLMLLCCVGFASMISACAPSSAATMEVVVAIDGGSAGHELSVAGDDFALTLEEGASAFDALVATGLSVGGDASYVTSIDGLAAGALGPESGWVYLVNDEMAAVAAGDYQLTEGDQLRWVYVENFDELQWLHGLTEAA